MADEQTAGRGREGRSWAAPPGAALLLSLGFRPAWLAPERVWRLAAIVALAMADAAEAVAGLAPRSIRLKWPNDLVIETRDAATVPQAGRRARRDRRARAATIRGRSSASGSTPTGRRRRSRPTSPATMTSLREAAGGRPVDAAGLLDAFVVRLEDANAVASAPAASTRPAGSPAS